MSIDADINLDVSWWKPGRRSIHYVPDSANAHSRLPGRSPGICFDARRHNFEGRVTALGPDVTYTFMCGKIPISTELKYIREFDVENRLTGDAGFLNVTIPLSGGH